MYQLKKQEVDQVLLFPIIGIQRLPPLMVLHRQRLLNEETLHRHYME